MSVFTIKTSDFSLKTCVFVTSEGQKKPDYFCNLFRIILRNSKHILFSILCIYGKYCVIIGSKYSQKIRFDSNFNQIFDYVHGKHCLIKQ